MKTLALSHRPVPTVSGQRSSIFSGHSAASTATSLSFSSSPVAAASRVRILKCSAVSPPPSFGNAHCRFSIQSRIHNLKLSDSEFHCIGYSAVYLTLIYNLCEAVSVFETCGLKHVIDICMAIHQSC